MSEVVISILERDTMTLIEQYTNFVRGLMNPKGTNTDRLCHWAMGLSGEAGEYTDMIKKHAFNGHGLDREKMIKELGDVCWYLFASCIENSVSMEAVLEANMEKLTKRYGTAGYSDQASIERKDETSSTERMK